MKEKYDELESDVTELARPSMPMCVDLIVALTKRSPATIIIDGLDELEDTGAAGRPTQSSRDDLIYGLKEILDRSSSPVKLLLSALYNSPVENRLRKVFAGPTPEDLSSGNRHILEITASKNSSDLDRFIDQQLDGSISRNDLLGGRVDDKIRAKIKSRLFEQSNGRFRWAGMQITRLCDDRMDEATVMEELEKPLPDIASLYDRSIEEIKRERYERIRMIAQHALKWLRCAQEPLGKEAFLEAVSIEGGTRPEEGHVRSACRTLVEVSHESGGFGFVDRFVEERLALFPEFSISDCHMMAATRCLSMMSAMASSLGQHSRHQLSFSWYAKRYWPLHYQNIDFEAGSDDKALQEERQKGLIQVKSQLQKFIMQGHKTSQAFNKWTSQIPDFFRTLGERNLLSKQLRSLEASSETPLHVICVFGFADLIKAHCKHFDFNRRNAHGQTALSLAVENN